MRRKPSTPDRSIHARAAGPAWPERRSAVFLAAGALVLATLAAYSNSFGGPMIFDDEKAIVTNPTIRRLWPLSQPLCPPPHGETVTNRPLLNLSLALNYAAGGLAVGGYHVVNLAIHLAAALLLFGIVRRTLEAEKGTVPLCAQHPEGRSGKWGLSPFPPAAATGVALAVALLWAVHPLQTESVTYIVQRAESLAGLLYLLVLYALIRAAEAEKGEAEKDEGGVHPSSLILHPSPLRWYAIAFLACLLGMAAKEVMVSAPLVALLYDRTFLAGSFREAWRQRRGLYLALGGTWLLLAWIIYQAPTRGLTAGFGAGVSPWAYLGTQFGAIVHYLKLCLWPCPLVLDYGTDTATRASEIVPYLIVVALLAAATAVSLWRWPKLGFLGVCFFAILAPTSSIVPVVTQTVAEHRMYLPSAAVVSLAVCGAYLGLRACVRRIGEERRGERRSGRGTGRVSMTNLPFAIGKWQSSSLFALVSALPSLAGGLAAAVAVTFGIMTFQRNATYESALSIWGDTLAKAPTNTRARNNLGKALVELHNLDGAMKEFQEVVRTKPGNLDASINIGMVLGYQGRLSEAIVWLRAVSERHPESADTQFRLAVVLGDAGQFDEAVTYYRQALALDPLAKPALNNLAWLRATCPQASLRNGVEAVALADQAVQLSGGADPEVLDTLAAAYAEAGRFSEATATDRQALALAWQQRKISLIHDLQAQLALYESGKPYHRPPAAAPPAP